MEGRFSVDDRQEIVDAIKELKFNEHPTMVDYIENYFSEEKEDEHLALILKGAQLIAGGSMITTGELVQALQLLLDSGEIAPRELDIAKQLSEPEVDTRPRDRNGKLLTLAQIQWSEYRQFAETASTREINQRKQTDPGFRNFVVKNLQREMSQPIDGAVTPVGDQGRYVDPTNELATFAAKYRQERSENLKPRNGYVLLAGEQMAYSKFLEMVNKCAAIRLL